MRLGRRGFLTNLLAGAAALGVVSGAKVAEAAPGPLMMQTMDGEVMPAPLMSSLEIARAEAKIAEQGYATWDQVAPQSSLGGMASTHTMAGTVSYGPGVLGVIVNGEPRSFRYRY